MSAAEKLTIDRLVRTAVQVSQTTYAEGTEPLCTAGAPAAEDAAAERVQVLLTPAARLALAAELLEPLAEGVSIGLSGPVDFAALATGARAANERLEGQSLERSACIYLGKVAVHLFEQRPATLDDARRLLEGQAT